MYDNWTLAYSGTTFHLNLPNDTGDTFLLKEPEWGTASLKTEDASRPRSDGTAMGADYRGGRTLTFELGVSHPDPDVALDRYGRLEAAWRGDSVRGVPGGVATLTCARAGRERAVYGRPRRIAPAGSLLDAGYISVVADFATVDDVFYGSTVHEASLGTETVTIGGNLPAWPILTIGAGTNPIFKVSGVTVLSLDLTIAGGDSVTLDTRPWKRTAIRTSDGASVAGQLGSTRLSRAYLKPGSRTISMTNASAAVSWQASYSSL